MSDQTQMNTPTSPARVQSLLLDAGQACDAGELVRAYELASTLVGMEPDNAEGHYLAGLVAIASSRTAIALSHFRKATDLDGVKAFE